MVADEFADMELKPEDIPDFETPVEKDEVLFPEQWLQSFKPIQIFPEAMAYCLGRGLSKKSLKQLDVRYDPSQRRVCWPFRNFRGELMGLQGRSIEPDPHLRYYQYGWHGHRNMHVWLGEHWVNLDMPVVLCEGPVDLQKIFIAYPNVCASFTSGLSRTKVKRLADAESIITFYDHGHGGDAAREAIDKYLKGMPILHIIPDPEDGDAGAMSVDDIRAALEDHVEMA
jgi:5S rRNA maturation endonuclease (ribonuclease M5)